MTKISYKVTENIRATMSPGAHMNPFVMQAVERVGRDLNAMLAFNPTRRAWIDVNWRGKFYLVAGKSKTIGRDDTTTDYIVYAPRHNAHAGLTTGEKPWTP